jgi:hypothetical protein
MSIIKKTKYLFTIVLPRGRSHRRDSWETNAIHSFLGVTGSMFWSVMCYSLCCVLLIGSVVVCGSTGVNIVGIGVCLFV